jgi:hypothetical protein
MSLAILADERLGLCIRQVFDTLLAAEVKIHPDPLVVGVKETVGVVAEAMHVAIGTRDAISQMSCSSAGPRGPAVWMLRLSVTGAPVA